MMKEGSNGVGRKAFGQNINRTTQKQFGHPLNLKSASVGQTFLSNTSCKEKKGSRPKWDTQNLDAIWQARKIDGRKKKPRIRLEGDQAQHLWGWTRSPTKSIKNKMVKGKMNDRGWSNDMNMFAR